MDDDDYDDPYLYGELGADPADWRMITLIIFTVGVLLVALQEMLPSRGGDCPEGEICGD